MRCKSEIQADRPILGFTLIELMITVAVIGILSAIAYPAYENYVHDARRTDAEKDLMQLSQFMERLYTNNGSYQVSDGKPTLPYDESPRDGSTKYYDLTLSEATSQAYTIVATPKNGMADDDCGVLSINELGIKGSHNSTDTADTDDCWKN